MQTLEYANSELNKYYAKVVGGACGIRLKNAASGHPFDDRITIDVEKGKGTIEGSNERAVLIGVYKFFYELGCRFVRPGKDGEILVRRSAENCNVKKIYAPKCRYRGICSEGAISEENVTEMVEWLPKIGMNSYFLQFVDGHLFFEKWYRHKESSSLPPEPYSVAASRRHYADAVEAIKRCGLIFQSVGHGWTTEPLGYVTYGDTCSRDEDIQPRHRPLFALKDGRRGFFDDKPGDTQLCYSNSEARAAVTDGIVAYLRSHPETDMLHFWLADGINNHCECEACKKRLPSEWYVTMLNELDKKLTKERIDTKIVFLIYCDLLFAPRDVTLENSDRFVMMYAPIARNYFQTLYTDENFAAAVSAPPYVRNRNRHPQTGGEYLYYLQEWQKKIRCDSFVFDYHLMTFPYGGEPSFTKISRILYEDMGALEKVGMNGNVSCQLQRIFLPTPLPTYVMAERLFGSNRSFEEIETECLGAAFGEQSGKITEFLHKAETFYLAACMRGETAAGRADVVEKYEQLLESARAGLSFTDENKTVDRSLKNLEYFIEMQRLFAAALKRKASGENNDEEKRALFRFLDERELSVQPYEDTLFRKEGLKSWI